MHKPLAEAILKTFHDHVGEEHRATLSSFPLSAWTDSYFWLDASGLALYFIDRLTTLGMEDSLPTSVKDRLQQNLADNREKTEDAFAELVRVNQAFSGCGIEYVNLKGISLVPHACKDPALRLQLDLDILTRSRNGHLCQNALLPLGYMLTSLSRDVWEFKSGSHAMPALQDLYKSKPQRTVEVHFANPDELKIFASELEKQTWNGQTFPVLSDTDRFLGQAMHVMKHLRGEWVRLSWLLEFRQSVKHWTDDEAFWSRVQTKAIGDKELCTAIGAATVLATAVFGDFAPVALTGWTVDALDAPMRMWLDRYGREAILSDFPGTKLYLLMPGPSTQGSATARERHQRLVPLHKPPIVIHVAAKNGFRARVRGWSSQLSFVHFRLRFHIVAGLQYLREAPRWKKHLANAK